jgi:hypothetical protein
MIKMSLRGGKVESLEEEMEEMEIWRSVTGRRGIRLKAMASGPALVSPSLTWLSLVTFTSTAMNARRPRGEGEGKVDWEQWNTSNSPTQL